MIYEYECPNGHKQDLRRKVAERDDPADCAVCGGPMRRMISRGHFELKGSGWYKDGYQKGG